MTPQIVSGSRVCIRKGSTVRLHSPNGPAFPLSAHVEATVLRVESDRLVYTRPDGWLRFASLDSCRSIATVERNHECPDCQKGSKK